VTLDRSLTTRIASMLALCLLFVVQNAAVLGQEELVVRPPPPALDDFETDADQDGVPDRWYNLRDARLTQGGKVGPTCLRFECDKPGRPSRASRAFGVDGKKYEAVVIGLWIRVENIRMGDRTGDEPGLLIDFLGEDIKTVRRGTLGPWKKTPNNGWVRVAKRLPIPESTRDGILTIGLLGSTGVLDADGLSIDLLPRGGRESTNLILNGDLELGGVADVSHWFLEDGARRIWPGDASAAAVELPARDGAKAMIGLGQPVSHLGSLRVRLRAKGTSLRGSGGAIAEFFFLDDDGKPLSGRSAGAIATRFSGTFDWSNHEAEVEVPSAARFAVLQIEKTDASGALKFDNVEVFASPEAKEEWKPYHVQSESKAWPVLPAAAEIAAGSALDASLLLPAPAGAQGFVTVKNGRLHFANGGRARFFGLSLLPPLAFPDRDRAPVLADRLARSGVNLVRFDDLDASYGPGRSLYDDSRDDTKALDPDALAKFDHFVAALKARGIYVAIELQSVRRYRAEDGVGQPSSFRPGGGPGLAFDPKLRELAIETGRLILGHVNPETQLALKDDPVLAWVVISGEQSLFNLNEDRDALPPDEAALLRSFSEKRSQSGRRLWQSLESEQWKSIADALREFGVKVPIAGCSHWRRESDFNAAQAAAGLDLIDDRLFWTFPTFGDPDRRSMVWSAGSVNGSLKAESARKRKADRPYVVGQWASRIGEASSLPFESADLLLVSHLAATEDWDGVTRRGVFTYPRVWGANAAGAGGNEDIYAVPEAINGIPPVFDLLPHAASILYHAQAKGARVATSGRPRETVWTPARGRLAIDTPHTFAVSGSAEHRATSLDGLTVRLDSTFGVVAASALGPEPIASAKRLLVTFLGRVEPTDLRWADNERRDLGDPGIPPLRREPGRAVLSWRRGGSLKAYRLDATGKRAGPASLERSSEGWKLILDGDHDAVHWEIVVE
jgi:hypothetical protein